jgi:hypothetical protein
MKANFLRLLILLFSLSHHSDVKAQNPYSLFISNEYFIQPGMKATETVPFGDDIIQVISRKFETFTLLRYSPELNLKAENTVSLSNRFTGEISNANIGIIKLKQKSYLFVRELVKNGKNKSEGMTALEFTPHLLDFAPKASNLFLVPGRVRGAFKGDYGFRISKDSTKFAFAYELVSEERNNSLSHKTIGFQVFDENLNKLWNIESVMPYVEDQMENESYVLSNDGKVYMLSKIYHGEKLNTERDKRNSFFHYEVFIFDKEHPEPTVIKVNMHPFYPSDIHVFEHHDNFICLTGLYSGYNINPDNNILNSAPEQPPIKGVFLLKLDPDKKTFFKINKGFYDFNKDNSADSLGIDDLIIRDIYVGLPDGSIKILAEQYFVTKATSYGGGTASTAWDTYAGDIMVISLHPEEKKNFMLRIKKEQHSNDNFARWLSFASLTKGNTTNVFYLENSSASPVQEDISGGYGSSESALLTAISINELGQASSYKISGTQNFPFRVQVRKFMYAGDKLLYMSHYKNVIKIFSLKNSAIR